MAEGKKSFVAYVDWIEIFEELSDEEAGKLVKHLFRYVNDQNPDAPDRMTKMCFINIKQALKRDLQKFEIIKNKRREAGRKGGKQTQANQANASLASRNQSNQAESVNDNVSVIDIQKESAQPYFKNSKLNDLFSRWLKMRVESGARQLSRSSIEALQMKMNYQSIEQNLEEVKQSLENGWLKLVQIDKKTYKKGEEKVTYTPPPEMMRSMKKLTSNIGNTKNTKS